ncbi:MAG: hypothetical protein IPP93_04640 [Chitinophagaceae bacterium]|nr:hypothetical protein [Chitinophagaceae bacterium]
MLSLRDQLAFAITGKENLEACSQAELEQLVNRHPYFPLGHLLLASKNRQTDIHSGNLSLYFQHTLWAKAWLNEEGGSGQVAGEQVAGGSMQEAGRQDAGEARDSETYSGERGRWGQQVSRGEEDRRRMKLPGTGGRWAGGRETRETDNPAFEMAEEVLITEPVISNQVVEEHNLETNTPEPGDVLPVTNETEGEKEVVLPAFSFTPVEPGKNDLIFEPYHTVDYFASQGIKATEEEKPADNFGVQLKRFTDWLKVMKKLPLKEVSEQATDPQAEQKVEKMAASSLQEKEVMTEAMAEVWEKQGNKAKAIEIYGKLSLLDPSKMAYFAAKIADLKK